MRLRAAIVGGRKMPQIDRRDVSITQYEKYALIIEPRVPCNSNSREVYSFLQYVYDLVQCWKNKLCVVVRSYDDFRRHLDCRHDKHR
jgi:hypothetical protein